jgi:hypothetical protein
MTLSTGSVLCAKLLIVLGVVAFACTPAFATVTYTYTGNPFDWWGYGYQCPSVCDVTGSFTVAQPLAPNLPEYTDVGAISASLTSGGMTVTLANAVVSAVTVSTDGSGNIFYFSFGLQGGPNTARIIAQYTSAGGSTTFDNLRYLDSNGDWLPQAGRIVGNPGTWSVTATPEPGTFLMMGTGLLGAVGAFRRKINL